MSIVLDVLQKIVLQNAYELTCQAAENFFVRCRKNDKMITWMPSQKETKPQAPPKPSPIEPEPEEPTPKVQSSMGIHIGAKTKLKNVENSKRDIPRLNIGPIDPPQCSCMRLCRDSYFS